MHAKRSDEKLSDGVRDCTSVSQLSQGNVDIRRNEVQAGRNVGHYTLIFAICSTHIVVVVVVALFAIFVFFCS